jgi:hypothetical protein
VDGNGAAWSQQLDGRGRADRVEMPRAETRTPPPDRQQCEVEVRRQVTHRREQIGVAGEVDTGVRARDEVADRGGTGAEGLSGAVVDGRCRGQGDRPYAMRLARPEGDDIAETVPAYEFLAAIGHNDRDVAVEHRQ